MRTSTTTDLLGLTGCPMQSGIKWIAGMTRLLFKGMPFNFFCNGCVVLSNERSDRTKGLMFL